MELGAELFEGLCIPTVIVFCLILGVILKKWIKDTNDRYIPTVLAVVGAAVGCIIRRGVSVDGIVQGAFSGLASTGMHQLFKQILKKEE